jgi:hypothetical protein
MFFKFILGLFIVQQALATKSLDKSSSIVNNDDETSMLDADRDGDFSGEYVDFYNGNVNDKKYIANQELNRL